MKADIKLLGKLLKEYVDTKFALESSKGGHSTWDSANERYKKAEQELDDFLRETE